MAGSWIITVVVQVTVRADTGYQAHEPKRCLERELLAGVERAREHYPQLGMPAIDVEAMPTGGS